MGIFDGFKSNLFDKFPRVNMHELNLDWVLEKILDCIKKCSTVEDCVKEINDLKLEILGAPSIEPLVNKILTMAKESGKFDGKNYVLTDNDKVEIAKEVENAIIVYSPRFVDNVAEMVDTNRIYVLNSTGRIWAYKEKANTIQTVTEQVAGDYESGRLGSSGTASTQDGYVITPYIDLSKYPAPFEIHLGGIQFMGQTYNTCSQYETDKTHIQRHDTNATAFVTYWRNATLTDNGNGTCKISITAQPVNKSNVAVGYTRFTGYGNAENANVYVTYEKEVLGGSAWTDTGIAFSSYKESISNMDSFSIANNSVKGFMETVYDEDYSYSAVENYSKNIPFRSDIPFPVMIGWEKHSNAVKYAVSVGGKLYYTAGNCLSVYNLIPDYRYNYKVYALCNDGSSVVVKTGFFVTDNCTTRMLYIDGIQNVRDIGGYAVSENHVKYGLIFRGSAMDEDINSQFCITDSGKEELVSRLGVRTDVDLRYGYNKSALGVGIDLIKTSSGYESYAAAVTNATQRGNFKALLESIVTQLTNGKPAYIHCSGGCDRTGTFVFLLLGLLGVSESDLAKEYELSSFSKIGVGRCRNSNTYSYKGLVNAIKAYNGETFSDKFVSFAKDCGICDDTITLFRNLMIG